MSLLYITTSTILLFDSSWIAIVTLSLTRSYFRIAIAADGALRRIAAEVSFGFRSYSAHCFIESVTVTTSTVVVSVRRADLFEATWCSAKPTYCGRCPVIIVVILSLRITDEVFVGERRRRRRSFGILECFEDN